MTLSIEELTREACRSNTVIERMEAGRLTFSFGLRAVLNPEIVLMAFNAGYDAILMNLEHTATGLETASQICCACLNVGITPIIVVPCNTSEWISRSLDVGAQGVIVPRINNATDARNLVKCAKYRPIGERPLTGTTPQLQYKKLPASHVMKVSNERTLAMVMIETVEGLDNIEEIAAVEGVDVLFVGTFDLTDDMGIVGQMDDPRVAEAYERVSAAAEKVSVNGRMVYVGCGGLEPRPDLIEKFSAKHSNLRHFMAGRDIAMLMAGMEAQATQFSAISDKVMAARK